MISLEEAQEKILSHVRPLPAETVLLADALGRFLAAPILSPVDLPPFDNSAMDGYAVRAADLASASAEHLVTLRLTGESRAGGKSAPPLQSGQCERIFTGAMLPPGADAVVMQEDVRRDEGPPVSIIFSEPVKPWENVRLAGEDIRRGTTLASAGDELTPQRLALLAASGLATVSAGRRPRVALLAAGDELREPGETLPPGGIYESNRASLAALCRRAGAEPVICPLVRDDLVVTKNALLGAFEYSDIVVTSGGVSVGELDWVKQAFTEIGGAMEFWKVAIRPGKRFAFGQRDGKLFFGVPGNPVSAFVTFFLLVRPVLLKLQGARETDPRSSLGHLSEPLSNHGDRRHFFRIILDPGGKISAAGPQGSHVLSSMGRANGLLEIPPRETLAAGTWVRVLLWD